IAAIPKVNAAKSTDEYRAAIDGLFAALGDAATYTTTDPMAGMLTPTPAAEPARVVDEMLVLSCRGIGEQVWQGGSAIKTVADYLAGNRKGVVFDCRARGAGADALGDYSYEFALRLVSQMVSGTVTLATYRERQHSGYPPQSGLTSGGYWSALA